MRKLAKGVWPVLAVATLFIIGNPSALWATAVPEIDPSSGMTALALLAGAVVVIRSCRKN